MNRDSVKGFRTKEDGLKGLTLKYSEFQTRDGVSYMVVRNDEYKRPVTGTLRDKVLKELKPFLVYGLGITDPIDVKNWVDNVRILGADKENEGWKVYAVLDCPGGIVNVGVSINEEVNGFDGFLKLMDSILEDIAIYIEFKNEKLDVRQMALEFVDRSSDKDKEKFHLMSEEEKINWATTLLEKNGAVILSKEDMGWTPGEEVVAPIDNTPAVAEVEEVKVDKKDKKEKIKKEVDLPIAAEEELVPIIKIEV